VRERTAIVLSPYFPPSTVAGVHRARHLAKHLPAAGWSPIILCVHEIYQVDDLDPALAALVPRSTEIVKVAALPIELTRPFGIGEISLRGWYPLRHALTRLLARRTIGTVFITGSPFYPMLFAPEIKRLFGVPVVLDFQDPWVSAWGASRSVLSKAGLLHRLATRLEPRALRSADFVTSVSETQNAEMAARYPWLDSSRMAGIPIGGDPDDFMALRTARNTDGDIDLDPNLIHLSYVGTFLPRSGPLMRALFRAFASLRATEPVLASRIRLNFVGTSNQPRDATIDRVRPIAAAEGVGDAVHEVPRRVPYLTALSVLARSNGVLLIGSDEPHYTASKIYPALMCGRPFLSLFHRASSAHAILTAAGGGRPLAFESPEELAAVDAALVDGLRTLAARPEALGTVNRAAYAPYEARAIAARFGEIFDRLAAAKAI
jgi:glycosyltransferase involved in cell wall biosynthesis